MTLALTGATGELGQLIVQELLETSPSEKIVAIVRNEEKAKELFADSIEIRYGDYILPDSLAPAFQGIDKLLFISSPNNDDMVRIIEHAHVIKAARDAGVKHLYYTSYSHADDSTIPLGKLHKATESIIKVSGLTYTFLRNPLYTEVFVNPALKQSINNGQIISNTADGKINSAPRKDLAKAIAKVISSNDLKNETIDLASSKPWTFDELAQCLSEVSGQTVEHQALSYGKIVQSFVDQGLPEPVAHFSAGIYQAIADGETQKSENQLKELIKEETDLKTLVEETLDM